MSTRLHERPEWKKLVSHSKSIKKIHLRDLFAEDPKRAKKFALQAGDLFLDYSKHRITGRTMKYLLALAESAGLRGAIDAMFSGQKINATENRAVLHVALRAPKGQQIMVDGHDVVPDVHAVLDKMSDFCNRVRGGEWKGHTGQRIRNVVNIGIGGSDLGPVMAYEALRHYSQRDMTFRFVSNVDGNDFAEAVRRGAWEYYARTIEGHEYAVHCRRPAGTSFILTMAQRSWMHSTSRINSAPR